MNGFLYWNGSSWRENIWVDYLGGFSFEPTDPFPMPEDLKAILLEAFLYLWGQVDQTTGLPAQGSGAGVVAGSGDVSRLTLADFGSISYDVGATVTGGDSASSSAAAEGVWGWLAPWASLLQIYRSEMAPGVAFA